MPSLTGWAAFAALSTYMNLFLSRGLRPARDGEQVWLFGKARDAGPRPAPGLPRTFAPAFPVPRISARTAA